MFKNLNKIRFLIEWYEAVWDEFYDDWELRPIGEIHREVFEDECEFLYRLTELENYENGEITDVIIDGIYTCELHKNTSR